tara:strand:- start:3566 stop:4108 length:543 start_codon:yes stop_codon:yes gene_type:complete
MTDSKEKKEEDNIISEATDEPENSNNSAKEENQKNWEEKYEETYDALLRAKAEVENIKKRSEKEISNAYKFSTESIFLDLIPIYESLDLAVSQDKKNVNVENLEEANKLLKNMFDSLLQKNSLQIINPSIEDKFDPNLHQAIKTSKDDKKENNTIQEVLQKGYKLIDRVIKPALVVVIKN